jgi:hypothetical protein
MRQFSILLTFCFTLNFFLDLYKLTFGLATATLLPIFIIFFVTCFFTALILYTLEQLAFKRGYDSAVAKAQNQVAEEKDDAN